MSARVGVLISGRGSNMQALLEASKEPGYPGEVVMVLSNSADARGLAHASAAGVATASWSHTAFESREAFDAVLDGALRGARVDYICLAGFMRILSAWFISRWQGRILNIHPSLLPSFPGLAPHARALKAGVRVHGSTVHFVTEGVDDGPIIGQAVVPVRTGDDETRLAARVLEAEHRLYPACLKLVAEGSARLENGRLAGDGVALI